MAMPELCTPTPEARNVIVLRVAKKITDGMRNWLAAEVVSSGQGNNAILDDYERFVGAFDLPTQEAAAAIRSKQESHYSRLMPFTADFKTDSDNEYLFARQLFCFMMNISGAFRVQSQLQALSQEDYLKKRRGGEPIGIDLQSAVTDRV